MHLGFMLRSVQSGRRLFDLASHAMLEDQPFDLLMMDEKFLLQERPGELGSLPMVVLSRIGHTGVIDFIDPALDVKGF